jgi:molybdopterin molybdotransferase
MITHEEALWNIIANSRHAGVETVELPYCLNRVLAQDIESDMFMPPFDKSAFDGYACRRQDIHAPLKVAEIIAAGCTPQL